ncbi:MAG: ABC transporter ATP-binding protein, partial [Oscillospiraceae bacterium]|nr:ABC transporter ATP-binding protein [Oscillospiraceae bacterium]
MKKYWFFALLAAGFMVAEVYVDLYQPKMMAVIVDNGILGLDNGGVSNVQVVISTGLRMLLVVLAGGLCGLLSGVFSNVTGQNYGNDLRKACFRRIMHFSFEQTDDF